MNTERVLKYSFTDKPGQLACTLNLKQLFDTQKDKEKFLKKLPLFLKSDPCNEKVYTLAGDHLRYLSEELIPEKVDGRPPLLLLLGNPASHSILAGMFFSFEANKGEHRFWKNILRPSGLMDLVIEGNVPVEEKNSTRLKRILELDYRSNFRIGLSVFISMPSGASDKWSGVAGIKKLLGIVAFRRLELEEKRRVQESIKRFIGSEGHVMTFQKNAWESIKSNKDPGYSLAVVKEEGLSGCVDGMNEVRLFCVPPTRLAGPSSRVIKDCLNAGGRGYVKQGQRLFKTMSRIYMPTTSADDWKQFLAEPEKQWKRGYSAKAIAHSWQSSDGLPEKVKEVLNSSSCFAGIENLITIPEHKVPLPGGSTSSQNDVWVLARTETDLISIAVEGKVSEPFGETVGDWFRNPSEGKKKRLNYLCEILCLEQPLPDNIRYQLLHRTASAIIEANRFHAEHAVMLIHSFSQTNEWFDDYVNFLALYDVTAILNGVASVGVKSGVQLHFAWAQGDKEYLNV